MEIQGNESRRLDALEEEDTFLVLLRQGLPLAPGGLELSLVSL